MVLFSSLKFDCVIKIHELVKNIKKNHYEFGDPVMRKNKRVKEENTYKTYRSIFFLQKIATNTNITLVIPNFTQTNYLDLKLKIQSTT